MTLMDPVRLNKAALRRPELQLGSIGGHLHAFPRQAPQDCAVRTIEVAADAALLAEAL